MKRFLLMCVLSAGAACASPDVSLRPEARPDAPSVASVQASRTVEPGAVSLRPQKRPRRVERAARAEKRAAARLAAKGAVCGDLDIQGVVIGRVASSVPGCGIADAVGVRSVAGITLSPRATMDCQTAQALKTWVQASVKPAFAGQGGGLSSLRVAAHYACRTRNNRPGGRISEHGKGKAIDISAFRLRDGTSVTVTSGWSAQATRDAMRRVHRGACGPFGTVLGPQADRYHQDHFHFDTAAHRGGPYCR